MTPAQLKEVTGKILSYLKFKLLCPNTVDEDIVVDYLLNQQKQHQRTDKYAFLDDTEFEALKNLLNANAVNEFIQLNNMHYDLEKRLDNYDNQLKQVDILRRSQVSGNAEIIKAYEDANRQLETLKKNMKTVLRKLKSWKSAFTNMMCKSNKSRTSNLIHWSN